MANYSTLKAAVADVVKANGSQAITGANLQTVLLSIINSIGGGGYIFNGVATPSTDAGTPDQNVFYIGGAGTYANFGTSVVVPPTNIAVFKYNGTWNCEQLTVENGGVFDISAFKAGGGTLATYADLAAALGTGGANVPTAVRKGGMSIKFVQTSDNKYVQYRLMSDTFNTTPANWQGVDDEPTAGSDNLVKSGGVARALQNSFIAECKDIGIDEPISRIFNYQHKRISASTGAAVSSGTYNYAITGFIQVNTGDTISYNIVAPDGFAAIAFYSAPSFDDFSAALVIGNGNYQRSSITIQSDGYIVACCNVGNFSDAKLQFANKSGVNYDIYALIRRTAFIHRETLNSKDAFSQQGRIMSDYGYTPATKSMGSNYNNFSNTGFVYVKSGDIIHYKLDSSTAAIIFYTDCRYDSFDSVLVNGSPAILQGTLTISSDGFIIAVCNNASIQSAELYIKGSIADKCKNMPSISSFGEQNQILSSNGNGTAQWVANNKVELPEVNPAGTNGKILKSLGNGKTEWSDVGTATQEQVGEAVNEWLSEHPEATTTVQDGSITPAKIAPGSFIAGGNRNRVITWAERDTDPHDSHVEGWDNRSYEWEGHAEGSRCFTDGKIGHSEGNACICSGNDSHAEGNRTVTGRKYFTNNFVTPYLVKGSEDAGDSLGVLNYVIVPDSYGDVTSYFPNKLTDNIESRYGAGTQKDAEGNIYANGFTPAVWSNGEVITPNDLRWAMHPYCIVRGEGESSIEYVKIAKALYVSGTGTKVYYYGNDLYSNYRGIYSSYCPVLLSMGNGQHSEGYFTSAVGYGAHSEGQYTEAWGSSSHAEGQYAKARSTGAKAEGYNTLASGDWSRASGGCAIAPRNWQRSFAAHQVAADAGKRQNCEIIYDASYQNAGWHIIPLVNEVEFDKTYIIDAIIAGKQTSGSSGNIGDEFVYHCECIASINAQGGCTFLKAMNVELLGRTEGMDGDGVNTGIRISAYTQLYPTGSGILCAKFTSVNGVTWRVVSSIKWIEMAI